jgi:hypothetical protein
MHLNELLFISQILILKYKLKRVRKNQLRIFHWQLLITIKMNRKALKLKLLNGLIKLG